jgi:hypothetical protein
MELDWREEEPSNPNSFVLPPPEFRTFFPKKGERWDTPKISDDLPIVDSAALVKLLYKAVVPEYNFAFTPAMKRMKGPLHHLQYPERWYADPELTDLSIPEEIGQSIGLTFRSSSDRKLNLPPPGHALLHEIFNPLARPSRDVMYEFNAARYPSQRMVQIVKGSEVAARKYELRNGGGGEESLHQHLGHHFDRFSSLFEAARRGASELQPAAIADLTLVTTHDMLKIRDRLRDIALIRTPIPLVMVEDVRDIAA